MVVHVDMAKARMNGLFGLALLALLLVCCFGLSLLLLNNPHKELQRAVFSTAERVHFITATVRGIGNFQHKAPKMTIYCGKIC